MSFTPHHSSQKSLLYEVSYIRPIVIFLLVFMHSFSHVVNISNGSNVVTLIEPYKWIVDLIVGFRIETIAFVAGYVFSYQSNELNKKYHFCSFVFKKFKRLIVPMLFFSTIYYFCFSFKSAEDFSFLAFLFKIFSGCGHLWFLSMLFWCFISIWLIDHYKLHSWGLLIILAGLSLSPSISIPFGFGRLPHFLFYVYAGYYLWLKKEYILRFFVGKASVILPVLLYMTLVFVEHRLVIDTGGMGNYLWRHIIMLIKSCVGILALYIIAFKFTHVDHFKPRKIILEANKICYGVYVFHQFILVFLYEHTNLYLVTGDIFTPWVAFTITVSLSIILAKITLKTKFGRFLLG